MTNPGAAVSFSDQLFSRKVVQTSHRETEMCRIPVTSSIMAHLLVVLQLQVKTDTKTNTEPAGAIA